MVKLRARLTLYSLRSLSQSFHPLICLSPCSFFLALSLSIISIVSIALCCRCGDSCSTVSRQGSLRVLNEANLGSKMTVSLYAICLVSFTDSEQLSTHPSIELSSQYPLETEAALCPSTDLPTQKSDKNESVFVKYDPLSPRWDVSFKVFPGTTLFSMKEL